MSQCTGSKHPAEVQQITVRLPLDTKLNYDAVRLYHRGLLPEQCHYLPLVTLTSIHHDSSGGHRRGRELARVNLRPKLQVDVNEVFEISVPIEVVLRLGFTYF